MSHSQPKSQRERRQNARRAMTSAGALQSHTRGLVSSSALTAVPGSSRLSGARAGSSLAVTLLWALVTASTLAAPILLAPTSRVMAEDLQGTAGAASGTGAGRPAGTGGSGNGFGGGGSGGATGAPGAGGSSGGGGGGGGGGSGSGSQPGLKGSDGNGGTGGTGGADRHTNGSTSPSNGTGGGIGIDGHDADATSSGSISPGGGGGGGVGGLSIVSGLTTIKGGNGGAGGNSTTDATAGGGGGGGAGLFLGTGTASTYSGLLISGGAGGAGINLGGGGGGGAGAMVNGILINAQGASIVGGKGGGASATQAGAGGGGDGVAVVGTGSRFENHGTVTGGDGGQNAADAAYSANAGAGIRLGHDATVVNDGTVTAGTSYGSGDATSAIMIVGDNTTLELQGGSKIVGGVNVSAGLTSVNLIFGGSNNGVFDSAISGGTGFTNFNKTGTSTWDVASEIVASNSKIDQGTVILKDGGAFSAASVTNNGTLAVNQTTDSTLATPISGTGGFSKMGSNTLTLSGANTFSGGLKVEAGTLKAGSAGAFGSNTGVLDVFANATADLNGNSITKGGLTGNGTVALGTGGLTLNTTAPSTFVGNITGSTGSTFVKQGTSSFILEGDLGASTVTITAGTFQLGNGGSTGSLSNATAINGSGSLFFDRSGAVTVAATISGDVKVSEAGGTLILTGDNTYTGTTYISAGATVQVGSGGAIGTLGSGAVSNSGTLAFNRTGTVTESGVINGAGSLTQQGSGTLILTGDNTYTGTTTINLNSILQLGNGGTTGSIASSSAVTDNGTLAVNRSGSVTLQNTISGTGNLTQQTAGTLILTGNNTYSGTTTIASGGTLQVGNNGTSGTLGTGAVDNSGTLSVYRTDAVTLAAAVSGTGKLLQKGAGTTTLTGNNAYTGTTTIDAGTLQIGNGGTMGAIAATSAIANKGTLIVNRSDAYTLGSDIGGTGKVVKLAAGTLTLSGANTFTGDLDVQAGSVLAGSATAFGKGTLNLAANTTASLNGHDIDLERLAGSGTVNLGSNALTLKYNGNTDYAGTMTGRTGSKFIKKGNGVFTTDSNLGAETVTIADGTVQLGTSGTSGGTSAKTIANDGTLILDRSDDNALAANISGTGDLVKQGTGKLTLSGNSTYDGNTTVKKGVLSVSAAANLGSDSGQLTLDGGTLQATSTFTLNQDIQLGTGNGIIETKDAGTTLTLSNAVAGNSSLARAATGSLTKTGDGTLLLLNDVVADTTISEGTVQVGNGGTAGTIDGNIQIASGATLEFNHSNREIDTDALSGTGLLRVDSPGAYVLKGNSGNFTGTVAANGTLVVDNTLGASAVSVSSTGDLSGNGSIAGDVTIADGGHLKGSQGQTLSIGGNLTLGANSVTDVGLGSGTGNELFKVGKDLTLGGVLNVTDMGGFGSGIYRIFQYSGTQSGTLTLGDLPNGVQSTQLSIQYQGGYVSLDSSQYDGANTFWNGSTTAPDGTIHGGGGTWDAGTTSNWTNVDGTQPNTYVNNRFSIFDGTGGTVTVDDTGQQVTAGGLQFAVNGYRIEGGDLELATDDGNGAPAGTPIIRVGDNTTAGADITATISSNLIGTDGFEKTDLGTLILTANNGITGDVVIQEGTLQLGDGGLGNTGRLEGDIIIGKDDNHNAVLAIDHANDEVFSQVFSGKGILDQKGTGTTTLTGANTYTGGTLIENGNLQIGAGGTDGSIVGDVEITNADSRLIANRSDNLTLDGTIFGKGGLTQLGGGTTTLTGNNNYTGETLISNGVLALSGNGSIESSSLVINNSTFDISAVNGGSSTIQALQGAGTVELGGKTLVIADGKSVLGDPTIAVFSGNITGTGGLEVTGGTQRLTGDNDYTGGTTIGDKGTLIIGDGDQSGRVLGTITVDGTLIYDLKGKFDLNPIIGDGDVAFEGGGTISINTDQKFDGEFDISADTTIELTGQGDVSDADGLNVNGKLDISGSDFDHIDIGYLHGEDTGQVELGDKNLVITDGDGGDFAGGINGAGGVEIKQGKQILSGDNTYTGDTKIGVNGELQLGNENHRGTLTSDVINEGILSGDGDVQNLTNMGNVSVGVGDKFGTLNVKGDYSSDGGSLVLHEELGDDHSKGDRLFIAGNTSGTTNVTVMNVGGPGALTTNGIKVITVGGQSDGQFNLIGDYVNYRGAQAVVGGAYAYTLEKGDGTDAQGRAVGADGNWYLRSQMKGYRPPEPPAPDTPSEGNPTPDNPTQDNQTPVNPSNPGTPEYQAGVPLYSAATSALASLNRTTGFASFNSRFKAGESAGNAQGQQGRNGDEQTRSTNFWSRVQGGYDFYTPNGNATASTYASHNWSIQAGVDGQFMDGDNGSLFGSAWFDYTRSQIDTSSRVGDGQVKVNGYGIGGALTWYGEDGIYLDGQAKATWYTSDMNSDIANESVASDVKSFGYAMSIEAGKEFAFNDRWSVTPQAQLIWSSLSTDDYADVFSASVTTPTVQSLTGRVGMTANYATNWQAADGTATRLTLGGIINVYQELKGGADYIMVSGDRVATGSIDKTWGEIGITANYAWANDVYSVFGKMSTASSLQNFGDSYSLSGNVGIRVKW